MAAGAREDYPGVSSFHAYLSGTASISTTYFETAGYDPLRKRCDGILAMGSLNS